MLPLLTRNLLLAICTASAFLVFGRAPAAVSLRTRDIEAAISIEASRALQRGRATSRAHRSKPA